MNNPTPIKYPLKADDGAPLKLFLYTVQKGPVFVDVMSDMHAILAYSPEMAHETLRHRYPAGQPIAVAMKGDLPVADMLEKIHLTGTGAPAAPAEPPKKETTKNQFVYSMRLLADKYIENLDDRHEIHQIMNKIKLDEPTGSPVTDAAKN